MTSSLVDVTGRARVVAVVVVLVILAIALAPSGSGPPYPFSSCLACGPRGLADGILNLLLFVPLGLALGWSSPRVNAVVLFGFVLSTAIELAQALVPGRDPSVTDIVFNTLGTTVGAMIARWPLIWLRPDRRAALLLTTSGLVLVATIMVSTGFLLSPARLPSAFISRSENDLALRYTTRASRAGLDEPEYLLPSVAGSTLAKRGAISIRRDRSRWLVRIGPNSRATLGPTVGQGWALLAYPDAIARRWGSVLNALWMVALFLPIGFWARGRRVLAIAASVAALLLALIPVAVGVVGTSAEEWTGTGIGLLSGAMLRVLWSRTAALSVSKRPE